MARPKKPTHPFRSLFEERIATELTDAKIKYDYETIQLEYEEPLRKNKARCTDCGSSALVRIGWYTPDFYLPRSKWIIETKGRFTAADRRKMLAVIEQHPKERIAMCFMRDNKIHPRSKTYYSDWCMENDIEFSIGHLKEEWLK
jgi:hypothetical protein